MHSRCTDRNWAVINTRSGPLRTGQKQILADRRPAADCWSQSSTHTAASKRSWRTTACRRNTHPFGWLEPLLRRLRNLRRSGWSPPLDHDRIKRHSGCRAAFTALRSRPGISFFYCTPTPSHALLGRNIVVRYFRLYAEWCVALFSG